VAVVIRLQRAGARNRPFYRMVVADSRRARDGRFIEKVGYYDPIQKPDVISIARERVAHWMGQGAQPSVSVRQLIRRFDQRQAAGGAVPSTVDPEAETPTAAAGAEEPKAEPTS